MRKILKVSVFALVFLFTTLFGVVTYHFSTMSTFRLVASYMDHGSPAVFRWGAKQALFVFHPNEDDIKELNRLAGARIILGVLEAGEARSVLEHLMANGLDIDSEDQASSSGYTALHAAVLSNDPKDAELLLELGADPTIRDDNGRTPQELARMISKKETTQEDFARMIQVLERAPTAKKEGTPE